LKLRHQLFLFSLLLLSLPWAGCQYLQAVDVALRGLQSSSLTTNAQSIADRLAAKPELFHSPPINVSKGSLPLYLAELNSRPLVDGYGDDWRNYSLPQKTFSNTLLSASLMTASYEKSVYFFIEVKDDQLSYYNPANGQNLSADHLVLTLYSLSNTDKKIYLYASTPGNITARYKDAGGRIRNVNNVKGVWRESGQGYQIEMEVEKSILGGGFNLDIVDYRSPSGNRLLINDAFSQNPIYDKVELISVSKKIEDELLSLNLNNVSSYVVNREHYIVAKKEAGFIDLSDNNTPWFIEWVYRKSLNVDDMPLRSELVSDDKWESLEFSQKNIETENIAILWYRIKSQRLSGQTAVSVVVPINIDDSLEGFLVLEKTTDQLVALTNSAFNRLFTYTLSIFLLVALGLIFYASWLSWRVSRLNRSANEAVTAKGIITIDDIDWPELKSNDELGDLSRSYQTLLLRLRESQNYLRGLSNKLSHELRTPIAIVRSSLDNIADVDDPAQQKQYQLRAKKGVERLNTILNAMSSANRIEESVMGAEFTQIKPNDFLAALADMYNDIYLEHTVQFISEVEASAFPVAQELFVQMMDKLIDNAVSFSSVFDPVIIRLKSDNARLVVQVENKGPLLPVTMQGRLFDSMVSVRQGLAGNSSAEREKVHLGLGLYVVRIIAELHQGQVAAANDENGKGVIFSVRLPT
jgi:dedicated sortase system histidine kinase